MFEGIDSNVTALNAVYASMTQQIANMTSQMLINNADEYTGLAASEQSLRQLIAENQQMQTAVEEGIDLLDETRASVGDIQTKADRVLELAQTAASGSYTPEEVAAMQTEYLQIVEDIDDLAWGELSEVNLLTEDGGSHEIAIGATLTVRVDTGDLTAEGLGLDGLDLTTDAAGAVAAAEAAIETVGDYSDHLQSKAETLDAVHTTLGVQATSYTVAETTLDSWDAAMSMVAMLNNAFMADVHTAYIAQANVLAATALNLLSD